MPGKIVKNTFLIFITTVLVQFDLPVFWLRAGSDIKKYEMSVDKNGGQQGKNVATIKSTHKNIDGFGTIMQTCLPGVYAGKRIKMTGYMRSKEVNDWSGFWLRINHADSAPYADSIALSTPLFYDLNKPVTGNIEWVKYIIILDVPLSATSISFGAMLRGSGQIWFDDINFEVVDDSLPVTKFTPKRFNIQPNNYDLSSIAVEPSNLTFEDY